MMVVTHCTNRKEKTIENKEKRNTLCYNRLGEEMEYKDKGI